MFALYEAGGVSPSTPSFVLPFAVPASLRYFSPTHGCWAVVVVAAAVVVGLAVLVGACVVLPGVVVVAGAVVEGAVVVGVAHVLSR